MQLNRKLTFNMLPRFVFRINTLFVNILNETPIQINRFNYQYLVIYYFYAFQVLAKLNKFFRSSNICASTITRSNEVQKPQQT